MAARDFLLFRLAGPMAAFGDIAVGERRAIWDAPSKSAVLGLVAAAVGIRRTAEAAHQALEDGLGFAVRIDAPGGLLRDYHTAQAPKARRNLTWRTRKAELADRDNLGTILSERLYRVEAQATVALWRKAGDSDLAALAAALARPHYVLSLGRKSCPLSEPVRALVVLAEGLRAAYDAYDSARAADDAIVRAVLRPRRRQTLNPAECPVWFELASGLTDEDALAHPIRQRRDGIRRRIPREFNDRREGRLPWRAPGDPAPDPLKGPDLLKGIVA